MSRTILPAADFKQSILRQSVGGQIINLEIPSSSKQFTRILANDISGSASILLGSWTFNLTAIWNDLSKDAMQEIGQPLDAASRPILKMILEAASVRGLPYPTLTINDDGGFEAFFKKTNRGLMLSVGGDLSLEAYGDYNGEIWRAKIDQSMPRAKPVNIDQIYWLISRY